MPGALGERSAAIVVSWNGLEFVARCLAALAVQTRSFDKVIVVDNGSDRIESLPPWAGPGEFLLERLGENRGFAAANNHGLALCADCEYVALVNPDAFLAPDWLAQMLDAAARYPRSASFASLLLQDLNPSRLDGIGDVYHSSGLAWRVGHASPVVEVVECEVFSPCAAAALYRRQAVADVGAFDEAFFCYMEDVDLGFRLRLAGRSSVLVPSAIARHVGGASSGGRRSRFEVYHGHRNLVWTFVKDMPGLLFWLLLPLHVALNLVSIVWFALRGQGRVILRAKWDALLGLPRMWRKRQQIQAARVASVGAIWRVLDKRLLPIRRSK